MRYHRCFPRYNGWKGWKNNIPGSFLENVERLKVAGKKPQRTLDKGQWHHISSTDLRQILIMCTSSKMPKWATVDKESIDDVKFCPGVSMKDVEMYA